MTNRRGSMIRGGALALLLLVILAAARPLASLASPGPFLAQAGAGTAETLPDPAAAASDAASDGFSRVMIGLSVVAVALFVVAWYVRKRLGAHPFQTGRRLTLLETLPLGGRRFLCLLSLDRKRTLVVGVSGDGFSLLSECAETADAAEPATRFDSALREATRTS